MKVGILDYGMGNITSVANALVKIGHHPELISDPDKVQSSDFLILPGVGAFSKAMERLKESNLDEAIHESVNSGKRLLGICLGMQLLFTKSLEFGINDGLNLIEGDVLPFKDVMSDKVPHMGWNNAKSKNSNFDSCEGDYYFVHSFYCKPKSEEHILFTTEYGVEFCSAVNANNQVFGVQFHPEKSQTLGLKLLNEILK